MSPTDFEDAIEGLELLLSECADLLLSEAFLHNAIRHGLSTIALDADTEIAQRPEGGGQVVGHKGPMFAYMHKSRRPGAKNSDGEWFIGMAGAKWARS